MIRKEKEAVAHTCSSKKVFFEISQNSQENACARASFFNKVAGGACMCIKKRGSGTGVFL